MKSSELKKLAKVCREAGIKHFKNAEFEFTLTDDEPSIRKLKPAPLTPEELAEVPVLEEQMTEEQMLFWSISDVQVEENIQ